MNFTQMNVIPRHTFVNRVTGLSTHEWHSYRSSRVDTIHNRPLILDAELSHLIQSAISQCIVTDAGDDACIS